MNPFDLSGPEFLALYGVVFVLTLSWAIWLRSALRQPYPERTDESRELDPYEVAYLAGGPTLAVHAALAKLVGDRVVKVTNKEVHRLTPLPANPHPLEEYVCPDYSRSLHRVRGQAGPVLDLIESSLKRDGLLVSGGHALAAWFFPLCVMVAVVLFGVQKIQIGMERGKPVAFLMIACVATAVIGLVGFARPIHRSQRGDKVLRRLQRRHAALASTARTAGTGMSGETLPLAVGLFGLGIFATGPLADLRHTLSPPSSSGGSDGGGGGCGGGGCGGGGGGGCGGCGGG